MEREFVRWIYEQAKLVEGVIVGPGDDAAIIRPFDDSDYVLTTDMLMDEVDFLTTQHEPELIGRKCMAVNLSDLASMGSKPQYGLMSIALPKTQSMEFAQRLLQGAIEIADEFGMTLIGGDTNSWHAPLAVNITAVGSVRRGAGWRRSEAQVNDRLLVTGCFGGSILGHHLSFQPRVHEALWLASHVPVHAAIDVSDGLAWDTQQLVEASHCGAVIDSRQLPISPAAQQLSQQDGQSALHHALRDGEDFELVLAVAEKDVPALMRDWPWETPLTDVGQVVSDPGFWLVDPAGERHMFDPQGYEH